MFFKLAAIPLVILAVAAGSAPSPLAVGPTDGAPTDMSRITVSQTWAARPAPEQGVTLIGRVEPDPTGWCAALVTTDRTYELKGGLAQWGPYLGQTVTLHGHIRTDAMTACQIGPFFESVLVANVQSPAPRGVRAHLPQRQLEHR